MNWIKKRFLRIDSLLRYINVNRIERFGIVADQESFFGGYLLIYKK